MKSSQIEMFLTAVETGSIAGAARELEKSRTTVSAAISALEDNLGVELLSRSGNSVLLTDVGKMIHDDCERLLQAVHDIEAKCRQFESGIESALRIGRDDALPESFWRATMREVHRLFPESSVSLYVAPPPELYEMADENMIDVAFGLLPETRAFGRINRKKLGQVRMMSVVHKDHPLAAVKRVQRADLERYTEVTLAYVDDEGLKALDPISPHYIALPFYEHLRDAVLDGSGWANVPSALLRKYLRSGTLQVLKHSNAMQWQPYGEITAMDARGGALTAWLSDRLENYLVAEAE
ncbi:LysR family transcriptional regulator [Enterovibrio nigricans]|uniref:DNA-binding transcriptional regulator, LysR family n=1 Tax=Enterovibrio nigricans DSM 22720 TaxID=1121868 RepID=A0A1T4V6C7_9GAMM|nr:LysR family transcriptional regulator [Enterovibrio nigricans]SKA60503.1 DNA-binding transcriptional regulator, LysR family [Enterovibrio nigricans DSM 22720]